MIERSIIEGLHRAQKGSEQDDPVDGVHVNRWYAGRGYDLVHVVRLVAAKKK